MARRLFDWHPELNLLRKGNEEHLEIMLLGKDGEYHNIRRRDVGHINADNVAQYYYDDPKEDWNPYTEFPCVNSPYPITWIEYILPKRSNYKGKKFLEFPNLGGDIYCGAYVLKQHIKEDLRTEVLYHDAGLNLIAAGDKDIPESVLSYWKVYAESTGRGEFMRAVSKDNECHTILVFDVFSAIRRSWFSPGYVILYLDEYGKIIKGTVAEMAEDITTQGMMMNMINPMLLALSLLNCKNVEVISPAVSKTRIKKRRKQNQPGRVVYKTLVINPMGKRYEGEGTGQGVKKAWHICRGHFKTFTEAAPLFGRVTGTFWWQHQVRGTKSRGEVRKEYEIGEMEHD